MVQDTFTDFQGLAELRLDARTDARSPETLRKVASQFEALFTQMMLKSARAAKLGDGLFESSEQDTYLDMFDAQIALKLAQGKGIGLAELLVQQLGRSAGNTGAPAADTAGQNAPLAPIPSRTAAPADSPAGGQTATHFVRTLWPHAERAAQELGTDPRALVAQAALETGWGRSTIRHPDGRNSFNVFGIKATPDWQGGRVSVPTLEYENGVAVRQRAEFRAYGSYAEAFADYANLIKNESRYREALAARDPAAFARALQRAGYATDPAYAHKIGNVLKGAPLNQAVATLKLSDERSLT
jgi:flagellar protein FlgJ